MPCEYSVRSISNGLLFFSISTCFNVRPIWCIFSPSIWSINGAVVCIDVWVGGVSGVES